MTVRDWLRSAAAELAAAGADTAQLDAEVLLAHALGTSRSWLLAHPDEPLDDPPDKLLSRRVAREPLAYIVGAREFYGRTFRVGPGVLVPRQETETLVEAALDGLGGKVLDVGTGSGCLAITIKLERPNWMVAACDVSRDAIKIARSNADALGALVHMSACDLFAAYDGLKFGLIVSNPPYVKSDAELQPEVGKFEPQRALFAGPDGLEVYRRLAVEAKGHLMPWGRLIVELGDGMESDAASVFERQGWRVAGVRDDLGGTPRAMTLQMA